MEEQQRKFILGTMEAMKPDIRVNNPTCLCCAPGDRERVARIIWAFDL